MPAFNAIRENKILAINSEFIVLVLIFLKILVLGASEFPLLEFMESESKSI